MLSSRRWKMKRADREAASLARHISEFLGTYAPLQKTSSENTLKSYRYALILYIGFLEREKGIRPAGFTGKCFERDTIEEWLCWLSARRGCCPATCNNRMASLRVFLEYLGTRDTGYLYLSLEAHAIPQRKVQKRKVSGLSRAAVKAIMEAPDTGSRCGRRDLALLVFLYSTAARIDEVLSMKCSQLCLGAEIPSATVVGKGDKMRTLYLLPKTVAHLKKYLKEFHGSLPEPGAYIFYSRNTGIFGKMTQAAVAKMLRKHAGTAQGSCPEVPLTLHAHQFRHAKASHWLEDGINLIQISFLLGHEQLQTTMVYLDITTGQEAAALATLEDEKDNKVSPKWKKVDGTLSDFCGIDPMN